MAESILGDNVDEVKKDSQEHIRQAKISSVKLLRQMIKEVEVRIEQLRDGFEPNEVKATHYVGLSLDDIESSRHWLGEALGALDVESPYKA